METLAAGIGYLDLHFRGRAKVIATGLLQGRGGAALVDPGPSSCLPALRRGLQAAGLTLQDVRWVLVTHIHLDHAGATGSLVRENPDLQVYVHERGAPHLIDPARLLSSARRLYGDRMEELWGEFGAVPAGNISALAGGERLAIGDRRWDVAYTPGHASHHVSYFDQDSGIAFVGDTAGIRIPPVTYVLPPTPPPDIDLEAWRTSVDRILRWRPDTLFLTHFGPVRHAAPHCQELLERLAWTADRVRASLARDSSDEERAAGLAEEVARELRRHMTADEVDLYRAAGIFEFSWHGLARYLRKKSD